jgi:hypothetical protein
MAEPPVTLETLAGFDAEAAALWAEFEVAAAPAPETPATEPESEHEDDWYDLEYDLEDDEYAMLDEAEEASAASRATAVEPEPANELAMVWSQLEAAGLPAALKSDADG